MRGKKVNRDFVSSYISNCILNGINNSDDIVRSAREQIVYIDQKIREAEELKISRSNLLDVVSSLEAYSTRDKFSEIKVLNLFKIGQLAGCKSICDQLKKSNSPVNLSDFSFSDRCIRKLSLNHVIYRKYKLLYRGDMFDTYMKFIFNEVPNA